MMPWLCGGAGLQKKDLAHRIEIAILWFNRAMRHGCTVQSLKLSARILSARRARFLYRASRLLHRADGIVTVFRLGGRGAHRVPPRHHDLAHLCVARRE